MNTKEIQFELDEEVTLLDAAAFIAEVSQEIENGKEDSNE